MFSEATFQKVLFPSSGNVSDYVAHIYMKSTNLDGDNKAYG